MVETDKFKIADYIRDFAIQVGNVKNKINYIDQSAFLNDSIEYTEESFDYFVNKKIREVFEEFYNYSKKLDKTKIKETIFPISLCFYNQDWDYIFDVLKDSIGDLLFEFTKDDAGKKTEDIINVKSWGHIYQNYDANLLKHIRNGLAHSKFDYDADTQKIVINMYKGTFIVELDLDFLTQLTMQLWQITESLSFENSRQPIVIYKDNGYKDAVLLSIKNGNTFTDELTNKLKELGFSNFEITSIISMSSIYRADESFTLIDKLKAASSIVDSYTNKERTDKQLIEKCKLILECFGLTIEDEKEINLENDLYKHNFFLKAYSFNMLNSKELTADEKQVNLTRAINMKYYDLNKNFTAYINLLSTIHNSSDKSWGKFRNELKTTNIPFSMDEISLLVDKSYFNYIYNYLGEKCGKPNSLATVSATNYFSENEFTKNLSIADVFYYIRNCVVHPNRLVINNDVYKLIDYDRRGDLAFEAEISREKFIELTNLVNSMLQAENTKGTQEDKSAEGLAKL